LFEEPRAHKLISGSHAAFDDRRGPMGKRNLEEKAMKAKRTFLRTGT
jgi:hypothetical protein